MTPSFLPNIVMGKQNSKFKAPEFETKSTQIFSSSLHTPLASPAALAKKHQRTPCGLLKCAASSPLDLQGETGSQVISGFAAL